MANDHPLTAETSDRLRQYIKQIARLPQEELEKELDAQIARLSARDRNQSPISR